MMLVNPSFLRVCPRLRISRSIRASFRFAQYLRTTPDALQTVLALAFQGNTKIVSQANDVNFIPPVLTVFSAILSVVPLQLLAYHAAKEKGCDIDKPKNLA